METKHIDEMNGHSYYILPDDILEKMQSGISYDEEDLTAYKMSDEDVKKKIEQGFCSLTGHSSINCNGPIGPIVRTGSCEVYYRREGANLVYCYTRCQS